MDTDPRSIMQTSKEISESIPDPDVIDNVLSLGLEIWAENDREDAQMRDESIERYRWYEKAGEEAVIERIYGSYERMSEELHTYSEGMSEEHASRLLKRLNEKEVLSVDEDPAFLFHMLWLSVGKNNQITAYRDEANCALNRLMVLSLQKQDLSQAIAVVKELGDPVLAIEFLRRINESPSDYTNALHSSPRNEYKGRLRGDLLSDDTGTIKAVWIALKSLMIHSGAHKIVERTTLEPIKQISKAHRIEYQILQKTLHKKSITTQAPAGE